MEDDKDVLEACSVTTSGIVVDSKEDVKALGPFIEVPVKRRTKAMKPNVNALDKTIESVLGDLGDISDSDNLVLSVQTTSKSKSLKRKHGDKFESKKSHSSGTKKFLSEVKVKNQPLQSGTKKLSSKKELQRKPCKEDFKKKLNIIEEKVKKQQRDENIEKQSSKVESSTKQSRKEDDSNRQRSNKGDSEMQLGLRCEDLVFKSSKQQLDHVPQLPVDKHPEQYADCCLRARQELLGSLQNFIDVERMKNHKEGHPDSKNVGLSGSFSSSAVKKVELVPGTGVLINKTEKKRVAKMYFGSYGLMIRALLFELVGEEELKSMTARGSKGKKGVPTAIFNAIETFVANNCEKKLSEAKFAKTVANVITKLKHKSKSMDDQVDEESSNGKDVAIADDDVEDDKEADTLEEKNKETDDIKERNKEGDDAEGSKKEADNVGDDLNVADQHRKEDVNDAGVTDGNIRKTAVKMNGISHEEQKIENSSTKDKPTEQNSWGYWQPYQQTYSHHYLPQPYSQQYPPPYSHYPAPTPRPPVYSQYPATPQPYPAPPVAPPPPPPPPQQYWQQSSEQECWQQYPTNTDGPTLEQL